MNRWLRILLSLFGILVVLATGSYIYLSGIGHVSTDDAYVKADMVNISAEVSGKITQVLVKENDHVDAGQVLFEIDSRTYRAGLIRANAQLDSIKNQIESDKAEFKQRTEELTLAQNNAAFNQRELTRLQKLKQDQAVSESKLDAAQHDYDVATSQVAVLKAERAGLLAKLSGDPDLPVEKHPDYIQVFAEHEVIKASVDRCEVRAPFSGIASKTPETGQYAASGAPIMSIVSDENIWVEANLKETELTHVRTGQPVTLHIDTYPDKNFKGIVSSISQATGAEFSILPPQNATGNWVKVVQRIPVRIHVTSKFDDAPLRAGTSTTVDIQTGAASRWLPFGASS